ncbi:transcriptional regulator HexR [Salinicola tamaricis]|uniref:transcriptional regulator HexR n=1 Tax=Salinicola tamaricis TaxID=1771309 RepID=UPI000D0A8767|nr:transcriptional regulator HexR [Salinicola tamaricis]
MSRSLFDELRVHMDRLRRSEQKVARFVLRHPEEVILMRITDLASEAQVSEPTVVRFCRAMGMAGFQEFKLKLAQMMAKGSQYAQFSLTDAESVSEFSHGIFDTTIETLEQVRDNLDNEALGRAIAALAVANRVEFYGYGASGVVAADAQHKFFRLQIQTSAYADPHMQAMSAATLKVGDVVVAISQTGRTRALLASAKTAVKAGATVIGLCPSDSPLAHEVSLVLPVDVQEDTEVYIPMTSRIAHLLTIDVLAVGVAKNRGPQISDQLKAIKRSLGTLRVPNTPSSSA